ncbi:hypothetical protein HF263_03060 [Rhizobium leguminosarum]|nr:hypothetical protein [Rhizobium leguminosarum]MBY3055058.1 hypothetical protein [Rhizobium leguminosarum]
MRRALYSVLVMVAGFGFSIAFFVSLNGQLVNQARIDQEVNAYAAHRHF